MHKFLLISSIAALLYGDCVLAAETALGASDKFVQEGDELRQHHYLLF